MKDEVREQPRGKLESRVVIPMIHVCIQTEQRSAATWGAQGVGWHQSDTFGDRRRREKKGWGGGGVRE